MENNENFVTEEVTAEQTAEETVAPKTYTQEEVDAIVGKRLARQEARMRKEADRKYGELVDVLRTGTGKEDVGEITSTFKNFYSQKGVQFKQEPELNEKDLQRIAKSEAQEIINAGYEDVVDEVDRLNSIGIDKMNAREKALFAELANHRQSYERKQELQKIGAEDEVLDSEEFKAFAKKFNSNTPYTEIYKIFESTKPKKEYKTMGSVKQTGNQSTGVKDYYSPEEIANLSMKDLQDPKVWEVVRRSMTGG